MRQLIEDTLCHLENEPNLFAFVDIWNNQLELEQQNVQYSFPMPACFIEIVNPGEPKQLGDGVQLYDPLLIRLHIIHNQLDAGNGTFERNLDVFDLTDKTFKHMQGFEPDKASAFFRVNDERDYLHTNIYHFIQDYKTTYLDDSAQRSTDGYAITLTPKITAQYNPIKPFLKGT
jgi:hypothetical protein